MTSSYGIYLNKIPDTHFEPNHCKE